MAGAGADAPKARLRVRAATATLIKPGATDLPTIVKCMREIDTALRAPSPADRDDAAAEFCEGPEGDAERSALRWCAAALHRGIPEALHPGDVKAATFTVGVALQILISVSGADHAQQFGHVTRSGAHEAWPRRGRALIAQRWTPDMWTPTGILPPLLRLARAQAAGAQIRLRALQLAGSVARDAAAREEMVAGGWLDVAWRALEHRPRPDHTESETKEFIYTRETWQFLRETLPAPAPEKIFFRTRRATLAPIRWIRSRRPKKKKPRGSRSRHRTTPLAVSVTASRRKSASAFRRRRRISHAARRSGTAGWCACAA